MTDPTIPTAQNQEAPKEIPSGGATLRGLDLSNPKDVAMVKRAIRDRPKRWRGLTDAVKDKIVEGMLAAGDRAQELVQSVDDDIAIKAVQALKGIVAAAAMMEGQNQADDHLDEKHARLDAGLATDAVKLYAKDAPTEDV